MRLVIRSDSDPFLPSHRVGCGLPVSSQNLHALRQYLVEVGYLTGDYVERYALLICLCVRLAHSQRVMKISKILMEKDLDIF